MINGAYMNESYNTGSRWGAAWVLEGDIARHGGSVNSKAMGNTLENRGDG